MTDEMMTLKALLEKSADSDLLREMIGSPSLRELGRAREELPALGFRRLQFTRVSGREGEISV